MAVKTAIVAGLAVVVAIAILTWAKYDLALEAIRSRSWGRLLLLPAWILLTANLLALIWRAVLVRQYRPARPCSDAELPSCTVIVPAYNEGQQVRQTLHSIVASDYPAAKLRIIAVDDGSKDDTWYWILKASEELPGKVLPLRLIRNRGKRHALEAGFKQAAGDVVVTIDSDSEVEPQTLRCLVSPFVRDAGVGAVAGNVRILNRTDGLIPRMLDVGFAYSFDFIRASQSKVNTVMCTPGALSAYRRDLLDEVRPAWLQQRFCGRQANIGEDRALTNLILRTGHHVHFQQTAVVYTRVPTGYRALCKMFLRWARSNVRETLVLTSFAFSRFRQSSVLGARVNLLLHWLGLTLGQVMKLATLGCVLWMPDVFGVRVLLGAAIAACVPAGFYAIRYRSTDALWAYLYSVLWLAGLSWIALYAWLTPHRTGWLTRQSVGLPPVRPALARPGRPIGRAA